MNNSLLSASDSPIAVATAKHSDRIKNTVLHAAERLLSRSLLGEDLLNVMVETQLQLLRHESSEQILAFCRDFLKNPDLVNPAQHEAIYAIAYCLIEDTCRPDDLAHLNLKHRNLRSGLLAEVQAIGLRYLVLVYWRSNRFEQAGDVFALLASQLDKRPDRRNLWHLCTLVSVICNDEQQHRMARRYSMQALGSAHSLEESSLVDRASYGYANSLSLAQGQGSSMDCFAHLRGLMESQTASLDPVLEYLVLVGSGRDAVHQGNYTQAARFIDQVKERGVGPRVATRYMLLTEEARLAHFKDQTLVRDSKLEEMRWLEEGYPSRLKTRAWNHVCSDINGSVQYHLMDGNFGMMQREAANGLRAITARCQASVRCAEHAALNGT